MKITVGGIQSINKNKKVNFREPIYYFDFKINRIKGPLLINENLFVRNVKKVICQLFNDLHFNKENREGTIKLLINRENNKAEIHSYRPFFDVTELRQGGEQFAAITYIIDYRYNKAPIDQLEPFTIRNLDVFIVYYNVDFEEF